MWSDAVGAAVRPGPRVEGPLGLVTTARVIGLDLDLGSAEVNVSWEVRQLDGMVARTALTLLVA